MTILWIFVWLLAGLPSFLLFAGGADTRGRRLAVVGLVLLGPVGLVLCLLFGIFMWIWEG